MPMTPKELEALLTLGACEVPWRFNEIPESVTISLLRRLDAAGFIEVRSWHWQNVNRYPGEHKPMVPQPSPYGWESPIAKPTSFGAWETFYPRYRVEEPFWELRLSAQGRAEFDRQVELVENERFRLNDKAWQTAVRTGSIGNAALAGLASIADADRVSREIRAALAASGQAVAKGGSGIPREWTLLQLRRAYTHLDDGKLKKWMLAAGLDKPA